MGNEPVQSAQAELSRLLLTLGGKLRSASGLRTLLGTAGFAFTAIFGQSLVRLLEARAAGNG